MPEENITAPFTTDISFDSQIFQCGYGKILFKGICSEQDSVSFIYEIVEVLYIPYELDAWSLNLSTNFKLSNCFFGAVELIKDADPDKYRYICYGVGYNARPKF